MSKFNESYNEYYRIIEEARALDRVKLNRDHLDYEYFENHHVIPRSLGGSNSWRNMVLLTPEEHYICHSLLPDFCEGPARKDMLAAWHLINYTREIDGLVLIGSKSYGDLKRKRSKSISGINHHGSKRLLQLDKDTGKILKIWAYASLAAEYYKVTNELIHGRARKQSGTAKGYRWIYEEDYNEEVFLVNMEKEKKEASNLKREKYISNSLKISGALNPQAKKVLQVVPETKKVIKIWAYTGEVTKELGWKYIDHKARNSLKYKGYFWVYEEDYENWLQTQNKDKQ